MSEIEKEAQAWRDLADKLPTYKEVKPSLDEWVTSGVSFDTLLKIYHNLLSDSKKGKA